MRGWMESVQSLIMRAVGTKRLHHALGSRLEALDGGVTSRLEALDGGVTSRLEALQARIEEREGALAEDIGALHRRLDAIDDRIGTQGRHDNERGEAVGDALNEMRGRLASLIEALRGESGTRALGEVRTEISGLRADLAREAELRDRPN